MIEIAIYNSVLPALIWLAFQLFDKDRQSRTDTLKWIAIVHGSVWTPVILLGMMVEWLDAGRVFTAVFLEHWSSNLNEAAYIYSMYALLGNAMTGLGGWDWWLFFGYFLYWQLMDSAE